MLHSIICSQFKAYDDLFYKIGNISNETETFERNDVVGSYGQDSIKLGDLFTRLVTPDHELLGGFQTVSDNLSSFFAVSIGTIINPKKNLKLIVELVQVVDSMYNFDFQHSACGQRGLCHVSLSSPLSKTTKQSQYNV